jgi:hypothetical protein
LFFNIESKLISQILIYILKDSLKRLTGFQDSTKMVARIELSDANIGWTQHGPSEYMPEKMKQWLEKYVWNREELSPYERVKSLYIVGPTNTGKTDTCYNLLNKNGDYCKVFTIDTYTNWRAFHEYIEDNGLPDFVLVDDINIEELGRTWKNLFGAQKTITYATAPTKKVTTAYGRPCIYLCNPDSDVFSSDDFCPSKKSWLQGNIFGGEPIYLEQDFISGKSVRKHSRFAGNVRCDNIDPEIRKYIRFESNKFETFPSTVQKRFLDEATEDYITELKNRLNKVNITDSKPHRFYGNSGHSSTDTYDSTSTEGSGDYYDAADAFGSNVHDNVSDAADAYVEWYLQNY